MSYAAISDLTTYGLPATALGSVTLAQQQGALDAASAYMDSKFRGRYALPLTAWGLEVTRCCAQLAAEEVLTVRGFNPANVGDAAIVERAALQRVWLDQVQRSAAHPNVTPQASQTVAYQSPKIISSSVIGTNDPTTAPTRGW